MSTQRCDIDTSTDRQTRRQTGRPADRQTSRQTGRLADRPADRQTDQQTGRPADRQADQQIKTLDLCSTNSLAGSQS